MSNQKAVEKVNTKPVAIYMASGKVLSYNLTYDKLKEVKTCMEEGKVIVIDDRMINVANIDYVEIH